MCVPFMKILYDKKTNKEEKWSGLYSTHRCINSVLKQQITHPDPVELPYQNVCHTDNNKPKYQHSRFITPVPFLNLIDQNIAPGDWLFGALMIYLHRIC